MSEHIKLKNGKTLRISKVNMQETIAAKLLDNPKLEIHQAQIDVYKIGNGQIVDRQYMPFKKAVKFGKAIKKEFPELGYKIIQVVE